MQIKHALLALLFFNFSFSYAQMPDTFGKLTSVEKSMESYEKEPNSNAVVLYERGDNYFKDDGRYVKLIKEYHVKIKILDEKGFDQANIVIPLRKSEKSAEELTKIDALTHNGEEKFSVLQSEIHTKEISSNRVEKTFTFPKLKKGSILEYKYTISSPYFFTFSGWNFQSNIPKIYSEFNAKIPANYIYNRALIGNLDLHINESSNKIKCFSVRGYLQLADCEVLKYAMKDIPSFKAAEGFMLAASNYRSRIDFELSEHIRFDGKKNKYTQSWKDVDKEFRTDKDIGRQLGKRNFFENKVSEKLLTEGDPLARAKKIFEYIQNHFTWNEKFGIHGKARVKDAFEKKSGNVSEINMSLINLLNAAGIKANLMLLSTRQEGLPKKAHPVMTDFNYAIVKVSIEGKDYLLDATDKYNPFGMLPFRALNQYGRVMDFKSASYWFDIKPETNNKHQVRAFLKFEVDQKKAMGVLDVTNLGYDAVTSRRNLDDYNEEDYLEEVANIVEGDMSIIKHTVYEENNTNKRFSERFEFELKDVLQGDMVYFNPFLIKFFENNPFVLEKRNYPVNFGYQRSYKYLISIDIPDGYKVHELPKNQAFELGDKVVFLNFFQKENANQIAISFNLDINGSSIDTEDYQGLKSIFKHVTDIQNNSLVIFKKE